MEKSALEAVHKEELERLKEVTTAEALEEGKKQSNESLLVLSKFLRAAAAKRQNGDEYSAENRAFEGALLLVYGGEIGAVEAMEKLISGSDEKVSATDGKLSELTCELDNFFESRNQQMGANGPQSRKSRKPRLHTFLPYLPKKLGRKTSLRPSRRQSPSPNPNLHQLKIRLLPLALTPQLLMPG